MNTIRVGLFVLGGLFVIMILGNILQCAVSS